MLKKIRVVLAAFSFIAILLLFLDFTGTLLGYFSWIAKGQLWPAILGLNIIALVIWALLTLLLGRIYCSVMCPLGIYQDIVIKISTIFKKNRFFYTKAQNVSRYTFLGLAALSTIFGYMPIVALLDPYSLFGKMSANLAAPVYRGGNNLLAAIFNHYQSYTFYPVEVRYFGLAALLLSLAVFIGIGLLAWFKGRLWCSAVCPVGTMLGLLSKWSLLKPVINESKCNNCGLCAKRCKACCIDDKNHQIDYSRCVACMDCLKNCRQGAISFGKKNFSKKAESPVDESRRAFIAGTIVLGTTTLLKAQESLTDGGLAPISPKNRPQKSQPVLPPGAVSLANLAAKCSGCQLCASVCKSGIIKSENGLNGLWQPRLDFSQAFCRPECNNCSQVCPTGAIIPLTVAEKSSRQIGRAVWIKDNCLAVKGTTCTACARHCPSFAIQLDNNIPIIDESHCIGCGACEYYCPARPNGAIMVEGLDIQKEI